MGLSKRGKWYGDSQADIPDELLRVGNLNGYFADDWQASRLAGPNCYG
jgi:hypothetical protein